MKKLALALIAITLLSGCASTTVARVGMFAMSIYPLLPSPFETSHNTKNLEYQGQINNVTSCDDYYCDKAYAGLDTHHTWALSFTSDFTMKDVEVGAYLYANWWTICLANLNTETGKAELSVCTKRN